MDRLKMIHLDDSIACKNIIIFSVNTTLDPTTHADDLNDIADEIPYDITEPSVNTKTTNNYSCNDDNLEELLTPGTNLPTEKMSKTDHNSLK